MSATDDHGRGRARKADPPHHHLSVLAALLAAFAALIALLGPTTAT